MERVVQIGRTLLFPILLFFSISRLALLLFLGSWRTLIDCVFCCLNSSSGGNEHAYAHMHFILLTHPDDPFCSVAIIHPIHYLRNFPLFLSSILLVHLPSFSVFIASTCFYGSAIAISSCCRYLHNLQATDLFSCCGV